VVVAVAAVVAVMVVVVEELLGEEVLTSKEYQACSSHALQGVDELGKAVTARLLSAFPCFTVDHAAVGR
jgi:hypothetical protein